MSLLSRVRNRVLEWWHDVPLPESETNASPIFQSWHIFAASSNKWIPVDRASTSAGQKGSTRGDPEPDRGQGLVLATWNVDSATSKSEARISAIISHLQDSFPLVDIIFLQEVSRPSLLTLLDTPWLRDNWYSSEADATNWGSQSFASMILVSRSRIGVMGCSANKAALGPIWRVKYPSRFNRDALCCDILSPSSASVRPGSRASSTEASARTESGSALPRSSSLPEGFSRIRLINVHLDSLPIQPSLRPLQLSIISSYLRAAGRGLVAGDFNSVLPEDGSLISENRLIDAWTELRPNEAGFTWGLDSDQPFPPGRLDKVAVLGLKAYDIQVIPPGMCEGTGIPKREQQAPVVSQGQEQGQYRDSMLRWSDHSGILCSFELDIT